MSAEHARCQCRECVVARAGRQEAAADLRTIADHRTLTGLMPPSARQELEALLVLFEEGRW